MFCTAAVPPRDYEYANGPFLLYARQTDRNGSMAPGAPSSGPERPRVAVFRCFAPQYLPQSIRLFFACHSSATLVVLRDAFVGAGTAGSTG